MADDFLLQNRFKDLAKKSYNAGRFTYTNFLSLGDLSEFMKVEREVSYAKYSVYGGNEYTERKIVRFGDPEELGYDEGFPISCLLIKPVNAKFSDNLTHRDFLGALMNLGIERETLGDIFITGDSSYLYCLTGISDYILNNLTKIRHTVVTVSRFEGEFVLPESAKEEMLIQVSSERVDAVVARVFKLSRDDSTELFREQKVFVNSRLPMGNDAHVKAGDRISVRGHGRFDIVGDVGVSKKGKINVKVLIYK